MRIRLLLLLALLFVSRAGAQVINATSCSQAAVQTACSAITNSTTGISIPACSSTPWTGQVTCTIPSGNTASVFTISGATTVTGNCTSVATCAVSDATTITDNDTADANPIFLIVDSAPSANEFRLTGITWNNGTGQAKFNGIVSVNGQTDNVRVDHSHFVISSSGSSAIQWQGCLNGVIDHSVFDSSGVANAVRAYNEGTCQNDSLGVGDQSWTMAPAFGTGKFLYMENDVFNAGASDDCTKGGKFVARFNTYISAAPAPTIQTHPTGGGGRERGCRAQEVYENQMLPAASNYIDTDIWISSGSAKVWGNTTTSSSTGGGTGYDAFVKWIEMRQNNNTYSQGVPPAGWGYCGTAQTGTASNWDQNTNASGYFCLDGPGAGQGDLLTGGFTIDGSGSNNVTNNATGCISSQTCAYPRQTNERLYAWMNTFSPTPSNPTTFFANQYSGSTQNVDYYLDCGAGSTSGCTSFTGATGVGWGTLAARPTACTAGVGYWATDQGSWNQSGSGGQGELFLCTATGSPGTWTLNYTPYTYPHPLVSGAAVTCGTPTFSPGAGTYTGAQSVTINGTCSTLCYTTNGVTPTATTPGTCDQNTYSGPVSVASSLTLQAIGTQSGDTNSAVGSAAYTINTAANTPTFSPVAGTYIGTQSVTISTTSGSLICWNLTGATITIGGASSCPSGSTAFTTAISVASSETLHAVAGGPGFTDSSVGSAAYTITPPANPVVVLAGKVSISGKVVVIQ